MCTSACQIGLASGGVTFRQGRGWRLFYLGQDAGCQSPIEVRFSAHSSSGPELTIIYFVLYSSLDYHNRANIYPFIRFISSKTPLTYNLHSPINTIAFLL